MKEHVVNHGLYYYHSPQPLSIHLLVSFFLSHFFSSSPHFMNVVCMVVIFVSWMLIKRSKTIFFQHTIKQTRWTRPFLGCLLNLTAHTSHISCFQCFLFVFIPFLAVCILHRSLCMCELFFSWFFSSWGSPLI